MFGAVQLGVMAACIVLFVPMGMAGWHLSRNKMLFFSGALFITLAVGVHLTPYFPSISSFLSSSSHSRSDSDSDSPSFVVLDNRDSCISSLHEIVYTSKRVDDTYNLMNGTFSYEEKSWDWAGSASVRACEFQKLGPPDASDLLNGSCVVVAGDSQARLVVVSLLSLVLGPEEMDSVRSDLFKRHSDYRIVVEEIGMKLDFKWAPYVTNITDLTLEYKRNKNYPDVLVMGAGLWDLLHITNSSDYGSSIQLLKNSVASLLPISSNFGDDGPLTGSVSIRSPHLFWIGMPMLVRSLLNTEEKREKMSVAMENAYDKELYGSKILRQSGGPLFLLDIRALSKKCGARCTVDGMHYNGAVYEAAVHIMLNALLIESHQKL